MDHWEKKAISLDHSNNSTGTKRKEKENAEINMITEFIELT